MLNKNNRQQRIVLAIFSVIILICLLAAVINFVAVRVAAIMPAAEFLTDIFDQPVETQNSSTEVEQQIESTIEPTITLIYDPILFVDLDYEAFYDIEQSKEYINILQGCINQLSIEIASKEYSAMASKQMMLERTRLKTIINNTLNDIDRYTAWESEYYYASKTYEFLRQRGINGAVACGIIGNMMIETSGGTLKLNPTVYDPPKAFYGLCQWSLYYRPNVAGMSFEDQLEYLWNDMEQQFETFGFCYTSDFTFEDFTAMEDPAEAALAFAKVYERCASGSYGLRKQAAEQAYKYFCIESE